MPCNATIDQASRDQLNQRLDALDYLFRLQSGRISRKNLMAIMHRRGLVARGDRRRMFRAIYEDMKEQ